MTMVKLEKGESSDRLVRRFLKKIKKSGILDEYRSRMYFQKPSEKKREEKKRRSVTIRKLASEQNQKLVS